MIQDKTTIPGVQGHDEPWQTAVVTSTTCMTPASTMVERRAGTVKDRNAASAANLAKLGNYIFAYAMLAALTVVGILVVFTTLGFPLDGAFGGIAIARILLQLMAATAFALVIYTGLCLRDFRATGWRRPALQFLAVASVFMLLGHDYGDMTADTVQLLQWVGEHATCATPGSEPNSLLR